MKALYISLLFLSCAFAQDEFSISKVTIGGYGELHINSVDVKDKPSKTTADFHRFVLFFGYNFNEKWSFKSELEVEHNFVADGQGELELEQAYVDYHHSDEFGFRAGVILAPVGYINENHEPPTFLGVERPTYSNKIIPTTWFDNGVSIYGTINEKVAYTLAVMGGLDGNGILAKGIRSGRGKGYQGNMGGYNFNNPTFIARADFIGIDGLNVGLSYTKANALLYNTDINGNFASLAGNSLETSILEFHSRFNKNNLFAKLQYGIVSFDKDLAGYDGHTGLLIEAGYDVLSSEDALIPFLRYEDLNLMDGSGLAEDASHLSIITFGLSYKPLDQVVFKADYSTSESKASNSVSTNTIAFGVGYMF
jgi:opacity protein-like surface antigen